MNYFLVDYENVNVSGLDGIAKLTEGDSIIIFYSENANTLTFGMHRRINESKADIQFQKVAVNEKNALDFQLCSYLGFLIHDTMTEENNYFVVSNDSSYSVLPNYWKKFDVNVKIVSNLKQEAIQTKIEKISPTNKSFSELEFILSKFIKNETEFKEVAKILKKLKSKTEINNYLCKKFDSKKGGEIYRAIKSFVADKPSN